MNELLKQKTLSISEVSRLFNISRQGLYWKIKNYPGCLDTEGKPIRIVNNEKLKKFNTDMRRIKKYIFN